MVFQRLGNVLQGRDISTLQSGFFTQQIRVYNQNCQNAKIGTSRMRVLFVLLKLLFVKQKTFS